MLKAGVFGLLILVRNTMGPLDVLNGPESPAVKTESNQKKKPIMKVLNRNKMYNTKYAVYKESGRKGRAWGLIAKALIELLNTGVAGHTTAAGAKGYWDRQAMQQRLCELTDGL